MNNVYTVKFSAPFSFLGNLIIEKSVIKFTEPDYECPTVLFFIESKISVFNKCIFNSTDERAEYLIKIFMKIGLISEDYFDDICSFLYSKFEE